MVSLLVLGFTMLASLTSDRTLTRWTWRTTLAAPCGTSRKPACSGGKLCTTAASTPLLTSHTPSGSTRRERCHQCSKPKAGGFKEKQKHSKNCQDLFQISVHKANLLKKVNHLKLKRRYIEQYLRKTECQITKAMSG